jgi:hypothetical protein
MLCKTGRRDGTESNIKVFYIGDNKTATFSRAVKTKRSRYRPRVFERFLKMFRAGLEGVKDAEKIAKIFIYYSTGQKREYI